MGVSKEAYFALCFLEIVPWRLAKEWEFKVQPHLNVIIWGIYYDRVVRFLT
jgi:hypothetical protein